MLAHQRIALIGAGNMAEAILAGLLHGGQFTASDIRKDMKVVRLQKGMKPKALLGDQNFDHQLTQLRKMGRVTGFEPVLGVLT